MSNFCTLLRVYKSMPSFFPSCFLQVCLLFFLTPIQTKQRWNIQRYKKNTSLKEKSRCCHNLCLKGQWFSLEEWMGGFLPFIMAQFPFCIVTHNTCDAQYIQVGVVYLLGKNWHKGNWQKCEFYQAHCTMINKITCLMCLRYATYFKI